MAQIETATFEPILPKTKSSQSLNKQERPKRECRLRKRAFDIDQYSSKRVKSDDDVDETTENSCTFALSISDTDEDDDVESKCSTSDDTEQSSLKKFDDNSDIEDIEDDTANGQFSKVSSDQHRYIPVVLNQTILQQQQTLSRHSKRLISQFKYLYNHGLRKSIQPTDCSTQLDKHICDEKLRWELRNTFNRIDLFKEGYCILSNESFPFYSLCYMCGSLGSNLIHCASCCEAYHSTCLNDYERPRINSQTESWLCPNCNVCNICGLLSHENILSRMTNEQNLSIQLISCFDCKRNFHVKCIKRFKDEQFHEFNNLINNTPNNNNNSIVSLSRLSNSYLLNVTWFCPSCIKCDCGQSLISNERNLLSLTKTYLSQQSLMCFDCLNNIKLLRIEKHDHIDKCHLCEKYIEQIYLKKQQTVCLLQCIKCKNRFHPKCDGYLNEDVTLIPHIKNLCMNIVCSKCDLDERDKIQKNLIEYKYQTIENLLLQLMLTLEMIVTDENILNKIQFYILDLKQLHLSREKFLNLHTFLNDLFVIIQQNLTYNDTQNWQSVINGCIIRQCPWFKSLSLSSNNKVNLMNKKIQPVPSIDHTYAINHNKLINQLSNDSLLNFIEKDSLNNLNKFENVHEIDKRKCQLCETLSDHNSLIVGRLISFGLNQWVHAGCILPAYAKNLDQPPYILRNIRDTVVRCQTKYVCALCSKLGASVHCCENECYQRFHCDCIKTYYSKVDQSISQRLNIKNGFLPNLTTLCLKHNGLRTNSNIQRSCSEGQNDDEPKEGLNNIGSNLPKLKAVNTSSAVYGDLSNNIIEFTLKNTHVCIGSLQIDCLGDFDHLIERTDENILNKVSYPNNYRASRLFWSIKNPRQKTVYHLHIHVEQTYHNNIINHKSIEHPITDEQLQSQELYGTTQKYFQKFQKQIDDHISAIDEFCQKTMVNKKGLQSQTNAKRRAANANGTLTKRVTKSTPSCVKRQTPKAALKNVSRPRNRFANEKPPQVSTETKDNSTKNVKLNDVLSQFNADYLKSTNVSQFALALVQALKHVEQTTRIQQQSNINQNSSDQSINLPNGSTTDKSTDMLLKQLLRSITVPQQTNDSQATTVNSTSQYRLITSTHAEISSSKSCEDFRTNLPSFQYPSFNGAITLSHTTDNSADQLLKSMFIPQVDGSIDDSDDNENNEIASIVMNYLIEQIIKADDNERLMDISDYVESSNSTMNVETDSQIDQQQTQTKNSLSSVDLVRMFRKWSKENFYRTKFTITNDDGFELISDDLNLAWSEIIDSIRSNRDDMNLEHLSMTNKELNGHKMFGLTNPTVKVMLNQIYTNNQQQVGPILLPLSSSPTTLQVLNNQNLFSLEKYSKKNSLSSCSRVNTYERKTRERQRFGWLLNQSRKIEYALKSFEIDDALLHSRRILLEEASVSLRLYHLHYFSERALLVGSSPIHGCGLFTLIDLIEGQMIVEYTGEVVRPCLTDKRERENEGKGFGCYMFTVDSMNVIDATHRGNKARFINHNCEPNCFAKTVLSGGVKHIVIYALIDITRGSELTYDYSFPEEDVKIPCHCGTSKCRVYLN